MAADSTPPLERRRALLVKTETTTGTAVSMTGGTDGDMFPYNLKLVQQVPLDERPALNSFENHSGVPGATMGVLTFESDFAGKAGAGVPPWASTLLPACGMTLTSQTYTFTSTSATIPTVTMSVYEGGRKRTITGAQGNWKLALENGRFAKMQWEFKGLLQADVDASLPTVTQTAVQPPRWANASAITIGAYTPLVSKFELDAGNNVVMRPSAAATSGYRSAIITSRSTKATMDPESSTVATYDWYGDFIAGTTRALSIVIGTVANNIMTISAPAAQIYERPIDARDGIVTEGGVVLGFNRNGTSIDSSMSLAFS